MSLNISKIGYAIGVWGTALILIWIGLYKFTPTEALAIKPLVANHPGMSWLYKIFSLQTTSSLIGTSEIIIGIGLILSFWNAKIGKYAGILSTIIFLSTLSFLFTTPGLWRMVDGFPTTDFFIIKDLALLSVSMMVWGKHQKA